MISALLPSFAPVVFLPERISLISAELSAFIEKGVSILVGSRDAGLAPECLRAIGVQVESSSELTVFLPASTAQATVANLLDNGRIAVCFSCIADHHTSQLKGRVLSIEIAGEESRPIVDRYRRAIAQELASVGLPQHITFRINHWPCWAVRLRVDDHYDQTPGPDAGVRVEVGERQLGLPRFVGEKPALPRREPVTLEQIDRVCFQGVVPSQIATCDLHGEPNVTYLTQVFYLGPRQVALSCQFFNKTKKNLLENPRGAVILYHPLTFESYRLWLRFDHAETSGPLFDTMAARIEVIASHSGMKGIFRLLSADVHEVTAAVPMPGFLLAESPEPAPLVVAESGPTYLTELRGLQTISARIAGARHLEQMLDCTLAALAELFGFEHSMVLVHGDSKERLVVIASRGYGDDGPGAEVVFGSGVIGSAAEQKKMVRLTGMGSHLSYGRAIRFKLEARGEACLLPEIELPGLPDAQTQLALPMLIGDRLIGVLAVESRDPLAFDEWDETFLQIIANQIAMGIDHLEKADDESPGLPASAEEVGCQDLQKGPGTRRLTFYKSDDCVFLDDEYLVRNVPGRILWRVLEERRKTGRNEFTNRELRLDDSLGLPAYRDNLESRLILLRKRLEAKCADTLRLVPVRRGRFAIEVGCELELVER